MNISLSQNIFKFLTNELGLNKKSIQLGVQLSIKNKVSLPISLWSYGLINNEELNKFYDFLYKPR